MPKGGAPCHTNPNVPVPTPAAVGLLNASNTVPNIKRLSQNNTTSTNATLLPTSDTVVHGSVSVTATLKRTHCARSAKSKVSSRLPRRYTTSSRSPRVEAMRRVTSWLSANPVTPESQPRAVTGGELLFVFFLIKGNILISITHS